MPRARGALTSRLTATSRFRSVDLFLVFNLFVFSNSHPGKAGVSVSALVFLHVVVVTGLLGVAFREYLRAGTCFSLIVVSFD